MKYGLYPSTIVKFNVNKIQAFQNLALHKLLNPPHGSNYTLHLNLKIPLVYDEAKSYYKHFRIRLLSHLNLLARNLSTPKNTGNSPRKIKQKWCRDLLIISNTLNNKKKKKLQKKVSLMDRNTYE